MNTFLNYFSNLLWGYPLLILTAILGLYFSFKTRFFQLRKLKKSIFGAFSKKNTHSNGISPFAAVCTALSASVGTGNIAGVAGAIALGGAGAIFWMWVSALLGMIIKFAETLLAVKFRKSTEDGFLGGPMYYIKLGLPKIFHPLAFAFAFFGCIAALGSGNAVQVNTLTLSFSDLFSALPKSAVFTIQLAIGIIVAIIVGCVLLGGATRISRTAETLVPAMVVLYLALSFGVIFARIERVPTAFWQIIEGAFNPSAVTGGAVGSFFIAMQKGIARGIFSNEAGLGTSAMAHANADTESPVNQGYLGIFEVFVDTVLICTVTAFAILVGSDYIPYGTDPSSTLTIQAFSNVYGPCAKALLTVPICFFSFTSIIGWGLYGMRCVGFIFGNHSVRPFLYIFCAISLLGAVTSAENVWLLSEVCNALMALPNMTALLLLSPVVIAEINQSDT